MNAAGDDVFDRMESNVRTYSRTFPAGLRPGEGRLAL
jgi:hypothetical protein